MCAARLILGNGKMSARRHEMLKIVAWVVGIIFVIGLLVVTGVFKMIF